MSGQAGSGGGSYEARPALASRAYLEAVLEETDDAVFGHDAEGRITSWNRGAERLFGYLEDEVLDQPSTVLYPEHLRLELELMLRTVVAGNRISHLETEIQRKDGMPAPILLSLIPIAGFGAGPQAVAIARDVTEQRLAQARLAEVEAQMGEAERLAQVGGWLWDVRTGAVQWSDGFHRIHQVDPLDFEGTVEAHLEHVHPDDRSGLHQAMVDSVESVRPFDLEYRIVRGAAGETAWLHVRAEPTIGSAGAVVGLRGIGQDVTHRRG